MSDPNAPTPTERQPHLIYLDLNAYENVTIVCPGAEVGGCMVYFETTWKDPTECRCVDRDCECRIGEHGGCSEFGFYIDDIGDACRSKPDPDNCGVIHWIDATGWEAVQYGDGWPSDQYPVKADVEWDEGARLVPWKDRVVK